MRSLLLLLCSDATAASPVLVLHKVRSDDAHAVCADGSPPYYGEGP
eukprot:gene40274-28226_t